MTFHSFRFQTHSFNYSYLVSCYWILLGRTSNRTVQQDVYNILTC